MEITISEIKNLLVRKASKFLEASSYKLREVQINLYLSSEISILRGLLFWKLL